MIPAILFIGAVSSFGVFCTAFFGRKIEETLPLSLFVYLLFVYIFGLAGFLHFGVILANVLAVVLLAVSAVKIIKNKNFTGFISNIITPASIFMALACALFAYGFAGMKVYRWDEYSHWASCVKRMFRYHEFCSNPALGAWFQSYPPAMAILQYAAMIIRGEWADWTLYFVYGFFCIALVVPFFSGAGFKKVASNGAVMLSAAYIITVFQPEAFASVYIDVFLSFITAFLMAYLFVHDCFSDRFCALTFSLGLMVLVLTKEAGVLFAVVLSATYFVIFALANKDRLLPVKPSVWRKGLFPAAAVAAAKLSWRLKLAVDGAVIQFDGKYNISEFVSIVFGREKGYRTTVFKNFKSAFFNTTVGDYRFLAVSYAAVTGIMLVLIIAVAYLYRQKYPSFSLRYNAVCAAVCLSAVVYIVGLPASYMYKFSEYEAVKLASLDRYMMIIMLALALTIIFSVRKYVINMDKITLPCVFVCLYMAVCLANSNYMTRMLSRDFVNTSTKEVAAFAEIMDKISSCDDAENIAVISQGDTGYTMLTFMYHLYPINIEATVPYSMTADSRPLYEGDIWTVTSYTARDFIRNMESSGCDYVAVINLSPGFADEYASVFESPDDIAANSLYKFDRKQKKLILVP